MSFATTGIYDRDEFLARLAAGDFNPRLTYERYLEIKQRQRERARRELLEIYGTENPEFIEEAPELTAEDEAILDRAWAAVAAGKDAAKDQSLASSGAA